LTLEAFGPYAGRQVIDFAELGPRSLFLITGPTGAGKTTILDGICYALYGQTSGNERHGNDMRSQYSDPGQATVVTLDFAVGDQTYRLRRNPEYQRPNRRGDGATTQTAAATLWRRPAGARPEVDGEPLACRSREVSDQIESILGFKADQFRQVVMLPQGQFRELLTADSNGRQKILETLFRTSVYGRMEALLKERRRLLHEQLVEGQTRQQQVLDMADVATADDLLALQQAAAMALSTADQKLAMQRQAVETADAVLRQGRQAHLQLSELAAAESALQEVAGQQTTADERRHRLDGGRRASQMDEAFRVRDERQREADDATQRRLAAVAALTQARERRDETAEALRQAEARREEAEAARRDLHRLDELTARVARLDAALAAQLQARAAAQQAAQDAAAAAQNATAARQLLEGRQAALVELEALARQRAARDERATQARDVCARRERWAGKTAEVKALAERSAAMWSQSQQACQRATAAQATIAAMDGQRRERAARQPQAQATATALQRQQATLESTVAQLAQMATVAATATQFEADRAAAAARCQQARSVAAHAEEALAAQRQRLAATEAVAAQLAARQRAWEASQQAHGRRARLEQLQMEYQCRAADCDQAGIAAAAAQAALDAAVRQLQETERAFHEGSAALLARQLQPGEPCPVCGSTAHPQPAPGSADVPDTERLRQLREALGPLDGDRQRTAAAYQERRRELALNQGALEGLQLELGAAAEATLETLQTEVDRGLQELEVARQAQAQIEAMREPLAALEAGRQAAQQAVEAAADELAAREREAHTAAGRLVELRRQVPAELLPSGVAAARLAAVAVELERLEIEARELRDLDAELDRQRTQLGAVEQERDGAERQALALDQDLAASRSAAEELRTALGGAALVASQDLTAAAAAASDELQASLQAEQALPGAVQVVAAARTQCEASTQAADLATAQAAEAARALAVAEAQVAERLAEVPEQLRTAAQLDAATAAARDRLQAIQAQGEAARAADAAAARQLAAQQADWLAADSASEQAAALLRREVEAVAQRLIDAGFASESDCVSRRLTATEQDQLEAAQNQFEQALGAARARVDRARAQTAGQAPVQLDHLEEAARAASAALEAALQARTEAEGGLVRIQGYVANLETQRQRSLVLDEDYRLVGSVADAANGDNSARLTFQRFVLGALLDDVLVAASARLQRMSRGRYRLQRQLDGLDRRRAAGLDLAVHDEYTGQTRPANTLSGGESFLAALALALGLADVVQAYAGGVRIDTLFIDEGFGSLDTEALDSAMQALMDLQAGGRLVAIISHVEELRQRIDARLQITPSRRGSVASFCVG
jgi:exonuclease SbcC